jgi:hypothetical protein
MGSAPPPFLDACVLALDLFDEQLRVRMPLRRVEGHQLRPGPVQVIGEEEDLGAQAIEI